MDQRPIMSWINLGEVFYVIARAVDFEAAGATVTALRPRLALDAPIEVRVMEA